MRTSSLSLVKRFGREERGASLVEYAILIALVSAALITTIGLLGDDIQVAFNRVQTAVSDANTAATTVPE